MKAIKKQTAKKTTTAAVMANEAIAVDAVLKRDLANAILIVSVVLNLTIFITWLVLQVTSRYDTQMLGLLFG